MKPRIFVLAAILIVFAAIAAYEYLKPPRLYGATIDPPKQMQDFALNGGNGPVHLSDFRGKITIVFFGFTHCTDVCPATMAKLSEVFNQLKQDSSKVQVIFISVDYKRDTPKTTSDYALKFRPDFIGLTGSQAQIDQVTRDFMVAYKLGDPDANGNYEVEHTSMVLILDKQGQLKMTWTPDQQPDEMASDLSVLIR